MIFLEISSVYGCRWRPLFWLEEEKMTSGLIWTLRSIHFLFPGKNNFWGSCSSHSCALDPGQAHGNLCGSQEHFLRTPSPQDHCPTMPWSALHFSWRTGLGTAPPSGSLTHNPSCLAKLVQPGWRAPSCQLGDLGLAVSTPCARVSSCLLLRNWEKWL